MALYIMANRHLSRTVVLQTLFEWDFNSLDKEGIEKSLFRNTEEFAPGIGDMSFMKSLLNGVLSKQKDIDKIIEKAAPDWPINKISLADRNVLRIGLYELLFADRKEVPAKVAINEAIEMAKTFGGDNSGKFVNGVLGSVYKEMGEPGKDEKSGKKKIEDIPYEQMPVIKLGGAVVYAKDGKDIYVALVHDVFGHWTLSKGKLNESESVEEGTIGVIKEEIGLDVNIQEKIGENEYVAADPELGKIRKQVTYFLAESPYVDLRQPPTGGLDDAKWFRLTEIIDLNFYGDMLPIITKAVNLLLKK
jgi:transcription antitermination protein NusB